jgi:hypothetical protein
MSFLRRGSPPEIWMPPGCRTFIQRRMPSGVMRRGSSTGPPWSQWRQLQVQAFVTSNETTSGRRANQLTAHCPMTRQDSTKDVLFIYI